MLGGSLDIAVVGGGPVGSRAAYKLALAGHKVAVFEKRAAVGEKLCCTGILSQECILNYNISPNVIYRQVNGAKIFSPSGEFIRLWRPETQACIVNRPAFDQELAGKAQLQGAEYRYNSKVVDIKSKKDGVMFDVEEKGAFCRWKAQAVVLATGFSTPIVKLSGLGRVGDLTTGVQTEVRSDAIEEVEVYFGQKIAPGFFAWLVPTVNGRCLAGLMTRKSPGKHLRDWLKFLSDQGKIIPGDYKIHYAGIPIKPLSKTYDDRLLVVGDAAGQVKPTTGGGIYFGLLCADIAACTLHSAMKAGDLSARRLAGYEGEWKKKLGQELGREYFARQVYQRLNDQQINAMISRAKSSGIVESLLKEDISFDWHGGLMTKVLKAGVKSQVSRVFKLPIMKG
jgi:digeranylgeranylglycerophospholipid reductase